MKFKVVVGNLDIEKIDDGGQRRIITIQETPSITIQETPSIQTHQTV